VIRGVVLDMDGTLCDTEVVWQDVAFGVAAELGVELPVETYLAIVGLPGPASRLRFGDLVAADFPVDRWFSLTEERALAACAWGVPLKPGVHELLDLLEQQAIPAAVCTSSTYRGVQRHLGETGVLERVVGVVAQGDYVLGKPSAEPYLTAAALLGVEPSACLAVEDSENGVRSAAAAGCVTVLVPDLSPLAPDVRALCAHVLDDLHAVAGLLRT
jgi:HAD superfamily hydrolase (TIGR01509 family)